ncbi:hypothetical protein EYF80_044243 [Liparis tanakae]|uniref:Uncharacterized protein n=1 Tax=Liparis tanakae TaxID=230148 RepID=A0A4Z2FWC7_9TELE|nr:hypothetical protein EYF80_044243 [Liparis tanakae]
MENSNVSRNGKRQTSQDPPGFGFSCCSSDSPEFLIDLRAGERGARRACSCLSSSRSFRRRVSAFSTACTAGVSSATTSNTTTGN